MGSQILRAATPGGFDGAMTSRITDLIGRHFDKIFILLLAAGLFVYASISPTFRLRGEIPPQFVETTKPSADQQAVERTARAYWDCAVIQIQWQYAYGSPLPQDPPPEFALAREDKIATDPATRLYYWHRLQAVWSVPSTWKRGYRWNFDWTTAWIEPTQNWLNRHLPGLGNGG